MSAAGHADCLVRSSPAHRSPRRIRHRQHKRRGQKQRHGAGNHFSELVGLFISFPSITCHDSNCEIHRRFCSRLVNYAGDFVILCQQDAIGALAEARSILRRTGLTIHETKTQICDAPREPCDFLKVPFRRPIPFQVANHRTWLPTHRQSVFVVGRHYSADGWRSQVVAKRGRPCWGPPSPTMRVDELRQRWHVIEKVSPDGTIRSTARPGLAGSQTPSWIAGRMPIFRGLH